MAEEDIEETEGTERAESEDAESTESENTENIEGTEDKGAKDKGEADKGEAFADAPASPAFYDDFTDDDVKKFAARYTTPEEMAKAGFGLRQQLSTAITPLPEDASPEQTAEHRHKMGVPEKPEGYELIAMEGKEVDANFIGAMSGLFHEASISSEQAKVLNTGWNKYEEAIITAHKTADDEFAKESEAVLRSKWGENYDRNKAAAVQFSNNEEIWGDNMDAAKSLELSGGRFLLDHPVILEAFSKAGLRLVADPLRTGMTEQQTGSLEKELDNLMKTPDYWQNEATQKRVAEINEVLHGNEPIVGEDLRRV